MSSRPFRSARGCLVGACALLLALGGFVLSSPSQAHEVRPAYLELIETEPGSFDVLWKQPVMGDRRLRIEPILPASCDRSTQGLSAVSGDAWIDRSNLVCEDGLLGETIEIAGLERTITDVLVRVSFLDGTVLSHLVQPEEPRFEVSLEQATGASGYFKLGVEHLLFGFDHILFVIGLTLFVRRPWEILKVVTAFTVAHSITLGVSAAGWLTLPSGPVEAVIALSILFLAVELTKQHEDRSPVASEFPWTIAFGFGLLHGFGFAGALAEIGLPRDAAALGLFLFNVGVEVGQLMIVAVLLLGATLIARSSREIPRWMALAPAWFIGILSSYWFIERFLGILR